MKSSKLVKRIVTCQGSIQLVTALSVIDYREQEQKLDYQYENYLVIYDLNSPPGQIDAFAAFIKKMAQLICDWKKIVYILPEQMQAIASKSSSTNSSTYWQRVYKLVGIEAADEIYLSRNWQFGNQLLINAYHSAEKICYGDSIGIYFAPDSKAFFLPQSLPKQLLSKLLIESINRTKLILGYPVLRAINFDRGYFCLPYILGENPPMPVTITDKTSLLKIFKQLRCLLDQDYISQLRQQIKDAPVSILLTSNFSEAGRMTLSQEIEAYREFFVSTDVSKHSVLIIKPHPRDSLQKMAALSNTLAVLFEQIIILSETSLFFLPFEAFFTAAFLDENLQLTNQVKVFAFSSACLSLKLLFDVSSFIGFGHEITSKFFAQDYAPGRIKHEQDLTEALTKI
ncbi:MAG: polysialyltransferase family glycosyltransferase [Pleurocapsa sp.]